MGALRPTSVPEWHIGSSMLQYHRVLQGIIFYGALFLTRIEFEIYLTSEGEYGWSQYTHLRTLLVLLLMCPPNFPFRPHIVLSFPYLWTVIYMSRPVAEMLGGWEMPCLRNGLPLM